MKRFHQINRKPAGILLAIPLIAIFAMVVFTPSPASAGQCQDNCNAKYLPGPKLTACLGKCKSTPAADSAPAVVKKKKPRRVTPPTPAPKAAPEEDACELTACDVYNKYARHTHGGYATHGEVDSKVKAMEHDHFWLWIVAFSALILALIALIIAIFKRPGRDDDDFNKAIEKKVAEKLSETNDDTIAYEPPEIDMHAALAEFVASDEGKRHIATLVAPVISDDMQDRFGAKEEDGELEKFKTALMAMLRLESAEGDVSAAKAKVNEIRTELVEPEKALKDAENELKKLEKALEKADEGIEAKKKAVDEAKDNIVMLPRSASDDEDKTVREALATAKTNLTKAEEAKEKLPSQIEEAKTKVDELKKPVEVIKAEVDKAQAEVDKAQAEVNRLNGVIENTLASPQPPQSEDDVESFYDDDFKIEDVN